MTAKSKFAEDDHRNFNRNGEAFDRGETFSGVPFEAGLEAVEELRALVPEGATLATFALRWILMHEAVTCVIPGGKRPSQVDENCSAVELAPFTDQTMAERPGDLRAPHQGPTSTTTGRTRASQLDVAPEDREIQLELLERFGPHLRVVVMDAERAPLTGRGAREAQDLQRPLQRIHQPGVRRRRRQRRAPSWRRGRTARSRAKGPHKPSRAEP